METYLPDERRAKKRCVKDAPYDYDYNYDGRSVASSYRSLLAAQVIAKQSRRGLG